MTPVITEPHIHAKDPPLSSLCSWTSVSRRISPSTNLSASREALGHCACIWWLPGPLHSCGESWAPQPPWPESCGRGTCLISSRAESSPEAAPQEPSHYWAPCHSSPITHARLPLQWCRGRNPGVGHRQGLCPRVRRAGGCSVENRKGGCCLSPCCCWEGCMGPGNYGVSARCLQQVSLCTMEPGRVNRQPLPAAQVCWGGAVRYSGGVARSGPLSELCPEAPACPAWALPSTSISRSSLDTEAW